MGERSTSARCGQGLSSRAALRVYRPSDVNGLPLDALAASRGIANVHPFAGIQPGQRVLDLGCGAGLDCLIAARSVGEGGAVVGVDRDAAVLEEARSLAKQAGLRNAAFVEGDLGQLPFGDAEFDVALSNCVLELCHDKGRVLAEAARVLAPGGVLALADIASVGQATPPQQELLRQFTGCQPGGVVGMPEHVELLEEAGFANVEVQLLEPFSQPGFEPFARLVLTAARSRAR